MNLDKTIFLDFDGVINNSLRWNLVPVPDHPFDKPLVSNINSVIQNTGAKIVVSSDWRIGVSMNDIKDLLKHAGFIGKIVGATPNTFVGHDVSSQKQRVIQINSWLSNFKVNRWIAIDDMDLPLNPNNFVKTNPIFGFTDDDAAKAIRLLNG